MPIKNYSTSVTAYQSVAEIVGVLAAHGATKIQQEYDAGMPISIGFQIKTPNGMRNFILRDEAERVKAVLLRQHVKADDAQAKRVAWRILKDWITAQMAILETEMVTIDEVFLPYMTNDKGQTVYSIFKANQLMLGGGDDA